MDLATSYVNPYLNFSRYWDNSGGAGGSPRNDSLTVIINDGSTDHIIAYYTEDDNDNAWTSLSYRIRDFMALTSNMTVTFHTADDGAGHLVEASIDGFLISDSATTETIALAQSRFSLYPNPTKGQVTLAVSDANPMIGLNLFDVSGKLLDSKMVNGTSNMSYTLPIEPGIYLIRVALANGELISKKVIKD